MKQIIRKKSGNCPCVNCGKLQDGLRLHPLTVWHKDENEKRGHNEPVCSLKCAEELIKKY